MKTYQEQQQEKADAKQAKILGDKLNADKIKLGFKTMYHKDFNTKVLVNPKNFESKLEQGYKFVS